MKLENLILPAGIGIGAVPLAPVLAPAVGRIVRPLARGVVEAGVVLYHAGAETVIELGRVVSDAMSEVRSRDLVSAVGGATGATVGGTVGGASGTTAGAARGAAAGAAMARAITRSEQRPDEAEAEHTVSREPAHRARRGAKPHEPEER